MTELFKSERVRVGDLVPHVKNPRKIRTQEQRKLWERLEKYGLIGIPVRDADNTILSGNQRCELMAQNGLAEMVIDVRTATRKLTELELKEVMLIENSHAGEFDLAMLREEFENVLDLDSFGIDLPDLEAQIAAADEQLGAAAEMPIVAKMSESYDSIVIVCKNSIDFNHLSEKLGLERGQCYKSSRVGMMRVVDAQKLMATWK